MAVTNLSVRHALPLTPEVVDIVVIDEASQCDIASALPLLYRAKRTVIIGDPNQLSHISMLNKADDQQLQREIGLISPDDQRFLYSLTSLFDMGRTVIGTGARFVHLLEHYRSRAEIIGFSNKRFYGDKLSVWTDYRKLKGSGQSKAVIWHNVNGTVIRPHQGSAYNLEEAKEVVDLIQQIVKHIISQGDGYIASLGVVTPFREQANKIRDLLEQKIDSNQLRKLDFIVDTAHKYQGDERDIMIFSPVISNNTPQTTLGFLGNTVNLFNVAITRARTELHIVGDRVACAQCNISHLSEFVKYIEQLEPENLNQRGGVFESPWEEVLYNALKKEGIRTIPQYPLNQYRLDLAVVDSPVPVDIEIDGELWHRDIDGGRLLADIKRDQHLIVHGWKVKRFWVYQLQHNLSQCVKEIKELLNKGL
jgi:superfamily I DNA and/or RNA helicase/very-short-patch-repair endonuclease